jgi:hypothetical protein
MELNRLIASIDSVGDLATNTEKPNQEDLVYYLFFDKGISYSDFESAPLPYIFSIIRTHNYKCKEEEKQSKKKKADVW